MHPRDATNLDLRFGLLALQVGLIDRGRLVAAFGEWTRSRGKTPAEILVEHGSIDAESRALLSAMAEKPLKPHGGDAEQSLAADASGREKLTALRDADPSASVAVIGLRPLLRHAIHPGRLAQGRHRRLPPRRGLEDGPRR